jgi:hypothetical protein
MPGWGRSSLKQAVGSFQSPITGLRQLPLHKGGHRNNMGVVRLLRMVLPQEVDEGGDNIRL